MPCYNNHNIARRRARVKSCPAGVTFEVIDVTEFDEKQRNKLLSNSHLADKKDADFPWNQRRQSLPCETNTLVESFAVESSTQLLNYSNLAGGDVDNSFCCKLVETHTQSHSLIDAADQLNVSNESPVHDNSDCLFSLDNPSVSSRLKEDQGSNSSGCHREPLESKDIDRDSLKAPENALSSLNSEEAGRSLDNAFLGRFLQEIPGLEVLSVDDNSPGVVSGTRIFDPLVLDSDVQRLECHVYGTEILVENLASEVEATRQEIEMSKRKQENEINDLISLNEEMQTIWSEKETEMREILQRFSAYRDAVDADSKEKDEVFTEELNKRDSIIKDLTEARNALEDELRRKTEALKEVINDVENFDVEQVQQLLHVNQLVACLLEKFSDQDAGVAVCQSISFKLETSIATIKEKDYTRYVSCLNVSRQYESSFPDATKTDPESTEDLKRDHLNSKLNKSFSSSVDEGTGYSIVSSDGERNDCVYTDTAVNGAELSKNQEQFSSEFFSTCSPLENAEFYEALEDDFRQLVKGVEEYENDSLANGYVDSKTVVKLLEEQKVKYQFVCKEKDAEVKHWIRKHKQDTKDLQSILEEQERAEAKSSESLRELQNEIEKLHQRNKFLESEVEFMKEQGEDDVCFLKESFEKNLSAQLRRQSQSFLSAEESSRNELAELETKNDELRKANEDLRREISEHCTEIKSWVFDILRISEEEYNEECHSITEVMAKLQKIIIENRSAMKALQEELDEQRSKANEPCSPPDTLSRSLGGQSWNSSELQKDICRYCKQAKWQRVLMGSFDAVEASLDHVKQDEVERFVDKLSAGEARHRKKHSLKDSLELADSQLEHLQRLSRQGRDSLETLGEDSLEEDDLSARDDVLDVAGGVEASSPDTKGVADGQEAWQNIHISPRVLKQYSILSEPEFDEKNESRRSENMERDGKEHGNRELELIGEEGTSVDKEEQWSIDEDNDGQEEDQDRVHVVNLYRSLVVQSNIPEHEDFVDGRLDDVSLERFDGESGDQVGESGDVSRGDAGESVRQAGKCEAEPRDQNGESGDELGECGDVPGDGTVECGDVSGDEADESGDQTSFEDEANDSQSANARRYPLPIPKITIEMDCNENFLEKQDSVEDDYFNGASEKVGLSSETQNEEDGLDVTNAKDKEMPIDLSTFQTALLDEIFIQNTDLPQTKFSESWSVSTDPRNSTFEFIGNFDDEAPSPPVCTHCSKQFRETLENFKTNLTEAMANVRKEREDRIFRELQDTKTELRECRSEYEKLENVCDDYRNYVDEFSQNLKRKNEELRKLKLNSGIMKTEIEWLRQALGITRNYAEF